MTKTSLLRLLGTLSVRGLIVRSGIQLLDRKLNQSGVLWDIDMLGYPLKAQLEGRDWYGLGFGGLALVVRSGDCSNTNRNNN